MSSFVLKPHQVEGVEWIIKRERSTNPSGGMLCDEMGLGKTIQMLAAMVRNRKKSTLVVVPKSIVSQWKSEIEKFTPEFKVCVYDGSKRKYDPECDVCVCPYSVVVDLLEHEWDRVILDEGHEIRNRSSLTHKTVMKIRSKIHWIVTGTPVFNRFRDFVALCQFIRIPIRKIQAHYEDIRREFILRRVKTDMVPLEFQNVELEMYESERKLYDHVYEQLFEYECILEGILRCRQVCSWPQMYYDGIGASTKWEGSTAKMDTLIAMIGKHPDEKSLVFTQFTKESHEIKRRIEEKLGRVTFVLQGDTEDRGSVIQGFKECKDPGAVFIIQIKTGGVGLNLQEATRVYITQPSWNPATELQAIARAHRNGQTKKVYVKKLAYAESDAIDNEITDLQILKSEICAQVLGDESIKRQIPEIKFMPSNFSIKLGRGGRNDQEDDDS